MTTQLFDCRFVVLHPKLHLLFIKILMSSSVFKKKLASCEHRIYALPCVLFSVLAYRPVLSVGSVVHQA